MVDHIEDAKDFNAFALCFESVVGFFYGQGGDEMKLKGYKNIEGIIEVITGLHIGEARQ